jgi:dTDP-4-amino-4,6-dideoxygalactose transaminase
MTRLASNLSVDDSDLMPAAPPLPFRIVDSQIIEKGTGTLGVLEASKHFGFAVKRIYFLTEVPQGAMRGAHAHKKLRQCFIALKGSVTLDILQRGQQESIRLDSYRQAVVLEPGCWRDLRDFSPDALLLVLASDEYDESDYLRIPADFEAWEQAQARDLSVPYLDLKRVEPLVDMAVHAAADEVLASGHYIGGPAVARFESDFAAYCEADHCVGLANGLQALSLVLNAAGIGRGDEVIVPAGTFVATALAVTEIGATPVLVDVEYATGLIDVAQVEAAITPRTRAIIPVHLYGQPADMDGLKALAAKHNLFLLEDAAQAHGARYKGQRCGTLGDAAAFSFYPTKNLGAAGDAGGMTTNDAALAAKVRRLGNYGSSQKYHHDLLGTNSRLDPIQAAILSAKLPDLDRWNARRRELAGRYFAGLRHLNSVGLPEVHPYAEPVWHVFQIRVMDGRRDGLQDFLRTNRIGTNLHYPVPVHLQECYPDLGAAGAFPNAERLSKDTLSLPLDPSHSEAEIDRVMEAVDRFFR